MIPVLHCVLNEKFTFTSKAAMFKLVKILFSTPISVTAGKKYNITVVLYGPKLYECKVVTKVSAIILSSVDVVITYTSVDVVITDTSVDVVQQMVNYMYTEKLYTNFHKV